MTSEAESGSSRRPGGSDMHSVVSRQIKPFDVLILLLMVVFTSELAVMELFGPLFNYLGVWGGALADATLLVLVCALPLWAIFHPVFAAHPLHDNAKRWRVIKGFASLLGGFFLLELLVMLFLPGWAAAGDLLNLADAGLTALLSAPLLYWLLRRLEADNLRVTLVDLLKSPLLLYLLMIYVVFLSALLLELAIPEDSLLALDHGPAHVAGALLLTLIVAPFLWLFVARPLRLSIESERLRAKVLYEQVVDAVVLTDPHGVITAVNPSARRIFGYADRELLGRAVSSLFDVRAAGFEPLLRNLEGRDGAAGTFREMTGWHRSGRSLMMEVSLSRILIGGIEEFLLIMRDVSERRAAERALRESDIRFREVFEQSEDAILFCKPGSAYVVEANATTGHVFGYGKERMRGEGLRRLFHGEGLARVEAALGGLTAERSVILDNIPGVRSDGSECVVALRARLMNLQGVDLVYCTLRDITERVRLEREAREIQARLIQTNKMASLGLLISGVAHEINNPNNYIMNNAQLLSAAWQDGRKILREYYLENGDFLIGGLPFTEFEGQAQPLLDGIVDGARRIDQIVGTLKQHVRPVGSGVGEAVDVNQVAAAAITIMQGELVHYTGSFRCELADGVPPVLGNRQQLGQVIINLLMNACQALPSRERGVSLITGFDAAAAMVTVTVRDEGSGIAADARQRIMEPFFTTKLDSGGTGLGLSICQSIISEHRGSIDFISVPGEGTTFIVRIPAIDAAGQGGNG